MKKGIASREVLSDAVIVVCASMVSIWLPVTALSEKPAAMVAIPSETAMGTVRKISDRQNAEKNANYHY